MDSNILEIIEEFMGSALAQWVQLFEKMVEREDGVLLYSQYMEVNSITHSACDRYMRLSDGIFLNGVMRLIDPNPTVEQLYGSERDDHMPRIQNFSILNRHLRAFYQEDLQQLILMPLPNVAILGQDPLTEAAVEELRRLLLLLLGCAVQCEKKDKFIKQIQCLDIESQAAIANCIQQITQDPRMVLPLRWEELVEAESADLELVFSTLTKHIQGLLAQRDTQLERMAELCAEREGQVDSTMEPLGGRSEDPPQGLALKLADSKAKLRHLKQQLEDKGEQILDYRQEMQAMEEQLKKLQKENRTLQGETRAMRALRDELDCARERATRAEHLHTELQTCKHRLRTLELTRTQLKEQQQLCTALQETKALLEEQLADARVRCSLERELERDNLLLCQRIIDVEVERDTERQRVDDLLEINMTLEAELRNSDIIPEPVHQRLLQLEVDSDEEMNQIIDYKPLSVEVGEASMLRLLGEEQHNTELKRRLEVLQAQQEACSLDAKDKLARVEMEHQNTLREFQHLKNENTTLKQHLEKLVTKLQLQDEKGKEEREKKPKREEEKVETGFQESCRGEGEGRMRIMEESESRGVIVGIHREAGVGEEGLYIQLGKGEPCDIGVKSKWRGEAEGGHKDRRGEAEGGQKDKQDNEKGIKKAQTITADSETQKHPKSMEDNSMTLAADQAVYSISRPDVEFLTNRVKEVQKEADRQAMVADDLRLKLGEQSKKTWEAEQKLVVLKAEMQHFKKTSDGLGDAQRQIETFQLEGLVMEEELCRLRSQAELHSMQTTVIATLEGERATLERDRDMLCSNMEAMRKAQRKGDQLEFAAQTLRAELERQSRSLETSRHREAELEAELCEAILEAESLVRVRDQALLETARLEHEKEVLQSELDSQSKEGRQRQREVMRLRQQLDSTTLALEHSNQRARALDADHRGMRQQLSDSKELCIRLQDLEKELSSQLTSMEESKQKLQEQYADSQAKISSLSQDLTNEKILSNELTAEVERVSQKLLHREAELRTTTDSLNQSQERIESLSQYIKKSESPLQVGKRRGSAAVDNLSNTNSDSSNKVHVYQAHTHEIPHWDQSTEVGKDCNPSTLQDYATGETETQEGERMVELDKERAVTVAGQEALMFKLSQSQEACEHLKEQVEALRRHSLSLQDSCTRLQTLNTQLQVEKASLSTQQEAIQARCSESEVRCSAQEAEAKVWAQERKDLVARIEALRHDHKRMMALQQRQEVELEELLDKHSQLRSNNRSLEALHRELETRHKELLGGKTLMEEKEWEIKVEKEKIQAEAQRTLERERELEKLKEDNVRLQAQQTEWFALQTELLAQGSVLRGELSNSQLERMRLEGELSFLRESHQSLDLSNARLTSQYQLLTQLKGNMEEENRQLAEQNQSLLKENRALLEQSLECRDQHYSQQREHQEKLSELRREKQKLVEKIMDQYRVLEPSIHSPSSKAKKSNWIADRMKKLIKPRGGGKEGRALFAALGSVENLADRTEFTADAHTPHRASDLRSAPVSPSPMRKAEPDISAPATPMVRSGSGGHHKLGSRRGWGIGLARMGSGVSQSFSPGDHKTPTRLRLRSNQNTFTVPWEEERVEASAPKAAEATLTSQGVVMVDQGRCEEAKVE